MNLINLSELAKLSSISRQTVSLAVKNGLLPEHSRKGNSIMIDLDDENVQFYINDNNYQRSAKQDAKKEAKKPTTKVTDNNKTQKKPVKKNTPETKSKKKPATKNIDNSDMFNKPVNSFDDLTPNEINKMSKIAEMQKKQMHVKILQKKYIPTDYVENWLFRYLEKLNSTLERSSGVFITDVGEKILEAGAVTPEHIEMFVNLNLEAIHNTKKIIIKELEKYEPKI